MINVWWLLLLLPAAALSGYLAAVRGKAREVGGGRRELPDAYLRGLNFLLNEEPDKAIEVFIHAISVDSDTVEMHLALGNLFRRRGEVERATRIHRNLVARAGLDRRQRAEALFELGQDYFKAGLLDRAESLFLELIRCGRHVERAQRYLLQVYELEKEWGKAITAARDLARRSGADCSAVTAQYHCEIAETALTDGDYETARRNAGRAVDADRRCVRATMQLGRIEAALGHHRQAIRIWRRIEEQDARFIGEVANLVASSYEIINDGSGLDEYLHKAVEKHGHIRLVLALAARLEKQAGHRKAGEFLTDWLRRKPSLEGLRRLLELRVREASGDNRGDLELLRNLIERTVEKERNYECRNCGFTARTLHWQCPGCKNWNAFLPPSPGVPALTAPAAPAGAVTVGGQATAVPRRPPAAAPGAASG